MTGGKKTDVHNDLVIVWNCAHGCDGLGWCMLDNVDVTVFISSPEQQELFLLNINMIILHDLLVEDVI